MNSLFDLPDHFSAIDNGDYIYARTGYTGEDGFEIMFNNSKLNEVMKYINDKIDKKDIPSGSLQRQIYDSAESARVEAIGSKIMPGISTNINAQLSHLYNKKPLSGPGEEIENTLPEVMHLLIREQLTGSPPPKVVSQALNLWRPWITSRLGNKLSELKSLINSQQEFALAIKNVLKSLEEDLFDPNTDGEKDEDETENDINENDNQDENPQSALGEEESGDHGEENAEDNETGDSLSLIHI